VLHKLCCQLLLDLYDEAHKRNALHLWRLPVLGAEECIFLSLVT